MKDENNQRKTPSKRVVGKEKGEKLNRKEKEKGSTPSVMRYFKKVEKPQSVKSLSGEGGWEKLETINHTVQLGGESSQKMKSCANQALPSLKKLNEKYQSIYVGGTQEKIIYDGTAQVYKVSQNVKTSDLGGNDDTAMFTVQNSCVSGQNKTE